jgi:hypothetical protein
MRAIDLFIQVLIIAVFIASLFLPKSLGPFPILICLVALGLWGLLYPAGILGWVKRTHPQIDPSDKSSWWFPRLIGAAFLADVVFLAVMRILHH